VGFPLAKYIVEDVHGGRLSVKSQLNVGSTFMVSIPAASR
jgi:signal transduction histidine kinase